MNRQQFLSLLLLVSFVPAFAADAPVSFLSRAYQNIGYGLGTAWDGIKAAPGAAWNGVKVAPGAAWNASRNGVVAAYNGVATGSKMAYAGVKQAATFGRTTVVAHPKVAAASVAAGLVAGVAYQKLASNPTKKKTAAVSTVAALTPVAVFNRQAIWNGMKTTASFAKDGVVSAYGATKNGAGFVYGATKTGLSKSAELTKVGFFKSVDLVKTGFSKSFELTKTAGVKALELTKSAGVNSFELVKNNKEVSAVAAVSGIAAGVAYNKLAAKPTKAKTAAVSVAGALLPVAFYNKGDLWNATKAGAVLVGQALKATGSKTAEVATSAASKTANFVVANASYKTVGTTVAATAAVVGLGYIAYKKLVSPKIIKLNAQQAVNFKKALVRAQELGRNIGGYHRIIKLEEIRIQPYLTTEQTGLSAAVVAVLNKHIAVQKALNVIEYFFVHQNGRVSHQYAEHLEIQKALEAVNKQLLASVVLA